MRCGSDLNVDYQGGCNARFELCNTSVMRCGSVLNVEVTLMLITKVVVKLDLTV